MTRPDHSLQDSTRLRFLVPRSEPTEGLSTVTVDLNAFFDVVERIGRNEALLLLLVRALRQRTGFLALRVHDLAWMLRVPNRRVIRWLDRLTTERLVVYHVEDLWGVDTVSVEIAEQIARPTAFIGRTRHKLPSHWFVQTLPLIGRTAFTVYLFFHWRESDEAGFHVDHLVATARLRGRWHARFHIARLRRAQMLQPDVEDPAVLLLTDPPPPGRLQRLRLRFHALPGLRWRIAQILLLVLTAAIISAFLAALHLLPPSP